MFTFQTKTKTARVQHRCTWCGEPIAIGEQYQSWSSTERGEGWFANKMHLACSDASPVQEEYSPYQNDRA